MEKISSPGPGSVREKVAWLKRASLREFYLWAVDYLATGILAHLLPPVIPRGFAVSMQVAGLCRVHERLGHDVWNLPARVTAHKKLDDFWHKSEVFERTRARPKRTPRNRARPTSSGDRLKH